MIGVAFGGWMYMRWGTFKSMLIFGIGQALTNLLYMWLALAGKKVWLLVLATSLDTGIGGMGLAAFVAFLVSLCSANFSATQYALLSALASIPSKTMGYVAGLLWPSNRLGALLPGYLPDSRSRAHSSGYFAHASKRTRGARSRRASLSALK